MAVESSSSLRLSDGDPVKRASDEQSSDGIDQGDDSGKKHFVPLTEGREEERKTNPKAFLEFFPLLWSFSKKSLVNDDPTTELMFFFQEGKSANS